MFIFSCSCREICSYKSNFTPAQVIKILTCAHTHTHTHTHMVTHADKCMCMHAWLLMQTSACACMHACTMLLHEYINGAKQAINPYSGKTKCIFAPFT